MSQAKASAKKNFSRNNSFISKNDLLSWMNDLLKVNLTLIEQLGCGSIYCQILDVIYPGQVVLSKVKWSARLEYDFLHNFKLLQHCFDKLQIPKAIPVNRLAKAKYQDNLEFAQWLKGYFDFNCKDKGKDYEALRRRGNATPYFGFCKGGVLPQQTLFYRNPNEKFSVDKIHFENSFSTVTTSEKRDESDDYKHQSQSRIATPVDLFSTQIRIQSPRRLQFDETIQQQQSSLQQALRLSSNMTPNFFARSQSNTLRSTALSEAPKTPSRLITPTVERQQLSSRIMLTPNILEDSAKNRFFMSRPINADDQSFSQSSPQSTALTSSINLHESMTTIPTSSSKGTFSLCYERALKRGEAAAAAAVATESDGLVKKQSSATSNLLSKIQELTSASQFLLKRNIPTLQNSATTDTSSAANQESSPAVQSFLQRKESFLASRLRFSAIKEQSESGTKQQQQQKQNLEENSLQVVPQMTSPDSHFISLTPRDKPSNSDDQQPCLFETPLKKKLKMSVNKDCEVGEVKEQLAPLTEVSSAALLQPLKQNDNEASFTAIINNNLEQYLQLDQPTIEEEEEEDSASSHYDDENSSHLTDIHQKSHFNESSTITADTSGNEHSPDKAVKSSRDVVLSIASIISNLSSEHDADYDSTLLRIRHCLNRRQ